MSGLVEVNTQTGDIRIGHPNPGVEEEWIILGYNENPYWRAIMDEDEVTRIDGPGLFTAIGTMNAGVRVATLNEVEGGGVEGEEVLDDAIGFYAHQPDPMHDDMGPVRAAMMEDEIRRRDAEMARSLYREGVIGTRPIDFHTNTITNSSGMSYGTVSDLSFRKSTLEQAPNQGIWALSPIEAIYAFTSWLTVMEDEVPFGKGEESYTAIELISKFAEANNVTLSVRPNYTDFYACPPTNLRDLGITLSPKSVMEFVKDPDGNSNGRVMREGATEPPEQPPMGAGARVAAGVGTRIRDTEATAVTAEDRERQVIERERQERWRAILDRAPF